MTIKGGVVLGFWGSEGGLGRARAVVAGCVWSMGDGATEGWAGWGEWSMERWGMGDGEVDGQDGGKVFVWVDVWMGRGLVGRRGEWSGVIRRKTRIV